jgi:hypothetical protein
MPLNLLAKRTEIWSISQTIQNRVSKQKELSILFAPKEDQDHLFVSAIKDRIDTILKDSLPQNSDISFALKTLKSCCITLSKKMQENPQIIPGTIRQFSSKIYHFLKNEGYKSSAELLSECIPDLEKKISETTMPNLHRSSPYSDNALRKISWIQDYVQLLNNPKITLPSKTSKIKKCSQDLKGLYEHLKTLTEIKNFSFEEEDRDILFKLKRLKSDFADLLQKIEKTYAFNQTLWKQLSQNVSGRPDSTLELQMLTKIFIRKIEETQVVLENHLKYLGLDQST